MQFQGEKLNGWSEKVEIFVTYRSKYLQKNDQNSVFLSEAVHGELNIWRGLPEPSSTFGFNCLIQHSTRPQIKIMLHCDLFLSSHYEPKCTLKEKVIKYCLQIFDVWNNAAGKKMRGDVHILVNCPIDTFLKEKQHSTLTMIGAGSNKKQLQKINLGNNWHWYLRQNHYSCNNCKYYVERQSSKICLLISDIEADDHKNDIW